MQDRANRPPGYLTSRLRRIALLTILAAAWSGVASAQQTLLVQGTLDASDPTYQRPYLFEEACYLSSVGSAVYYDVVEVLLVDTSPPVHFLANLCAQTAFDSVLYYYQKPNGVAGAFNPNAPCANLVLYNDDYCDAQSALNSSNLGPGHLTVVISTFQNGEGGDYALSALSNDADLGAVIFYDGFEPDLRNWSSTSL